jgi:hypothetical protein
MRVIHPQRSVGQMSSGDSLNDLRQWVAERHALTDALEAALLATTEQAARVGRLLQEEQSTTTALQLLETNASQFLNLIRDVQEYPPIPDQETNAHFRAALAQWADAAQTIVEICERLDAGEVMLVGKALDAGTDEFYRMADALRRATGQPPDANNPMT